MSFGFALLLVAGVFLIQTGCGNHEGGSPSAATNSASSSGNPITAPVDYLGAIGKAKKSASKVATSVGITEAIKMFYIQEGRYPKDLNELVSPDYLPKLPAPPPGMKFDYNPTNGVVKVVSK
jgi:hypothetical protein